MNKLVDKFSHAHLCRFSLAAYATCVRRFSAFFCSFAMCEMVFGFFSVRSRCVLRETMMMMRRDDMYKIRANVQRESSFVINLSISEDAALVL